MKPYILYLGRIVPEKRIEWLIDAYNKIDTKIPLYIIGFAQDDDYERSIKAMASNKRIFCGNWVKDDKKKIFTGAKVFVLPSSLEGQPIALLEAMSYKVPCLVSDLPQLKEVITDNENGFLFKHQSFDSLTSRLKEVLSLDKETLLRVGIKAKEKIEKDHNVNNVIEKFKKVYDSTRIAFIGQKGIPAMGVSSISGGIESYVQEVGEILCNEEYDVSIYVRGRQGIREYEGMRLIHIPVVKGKHLGPFLYVLFCSIDSIFRKFDIIHYQGIGASFFCWLPRLFGKKVVLTIHSLPQHSPKWNFLARLFLRFSGFIGLCFANKVIVVSQDLKGKCKRNVECISNAISTKEIRL